MPCSTKLSTCSNKNAKSDLTLIPDKLDWGGRRVKKNMRQDFWIALPTEICCLHYQIIFYPFEEVFHLI